MRGGIQAAMALGAGYVLGRKHKLRNAAILAAVTATGMSGGFTKALVGRGLKALESTELAGKLAPQLGDVADRARSELLDAGKTAAMAVVNNRVDSLSDSLHSRAQALRDPAAAGTGIAEVLRGGGSGDHAEAEGSARGGPGSARRYESAGGRDEYRAGRGGRDKNRYDAENETDDNGYQHEREDAYDEDYEPTEEDEGSDGYEPDDQDGQDDNAGRAPASARRPGRISSPVSRSGR
jgi:hypothetical protein